MNPPRGRDVMPARVFALLSLAVITSLTMDARLAAQQTPPAATETEIATAPVTLDGVVLFRVRGVSSLPAESRAGLIAERIRSVAANPAIAPESLRTVEAEGLTRVLAGDVLVMGVVDADASLEQVTRVALAGAHLSRIRQAILDYRAARSSAALRRSGLNALGATFALGLSVVVLVFFWRWVERRLRHRLQSVQIQSLELIRRERLRSLVRNAVLLLRTVGFLALALMYVGYVLRQFPWTRGLSQNMAAFALSPLQVMASGFVERIPSLVFLAVLFVVVRVALRLIRIFFDALGSGSVRLERFDPVWAEPTYKMVRIAVVAFALVVAYPYIPGSQTAAFGGISVFIGVLFSLGSTSAIANIVAGYMLTYRRALKVGERVKIGEAFGDVIATTLQATHLRTIKNEEIIIPNSQILAGEVINYSTLARDQGLILHTEVGIGYETPWRQVEAMLMMAADRTATLLKDPRPFVRQLRLADFAVTYEINAYCHDVQAMGQIYTELHRNILDCFNEHGVQIMTPAYEGDPSEPKVVAQKDWYMSPAAAPTSAPPAAADLTTRKPA
jgi:small-conductance mechanosensitive channel